MRVCNHKWEYISTERVPTEQWNYGERIYKEEVVVYCPICHKHERLNKDEWENKNYNSKYPEDYIEEKRLIVHFNKDKRCTFTCENALFNLPMLTDVVLSVPVKDTKDMENFFRNK